MIPIRKVVPVRSNRTESAGQVERAVQLFAVIHLLVIGVSHVFASRAWSEFFIALRERGRPGVFFVGLLSLGFGSIIAAFHAVWSGVPLLLTVLGWVQCVKGAVYLTFPDVGLRQLGRVTADRHRVFCLSFRVVSSSV